MRITWEQDPANEHRFIGETARYRFVMLAPPRQPAGLMVHFAHEDPAAKPIDRRTCRSRRQAERIAQRFENREDAKRLR